MKINQKFLYDYSFRRKFTLMDLAVASIVILMLLTTLKTIRGTVKEKYAKSGNIIITATEQMMDMGIESAISLATGIYSNERLYEFLDNTYTSSEYYEAYYPFQNSAVLGVGGNNIVKSVTIYTQNKSVLSGGYICPLSEAEDSVWYQYYKKTNKLVFLSNDDEKGTLTLVRKLDYSYLSTGDSFVCLELDLSVFASYFSRLGFDGDLYIVSGHNLIYSNSDDVKSESDIKITPEFQCITRNYYSAEIQYYSKEQKTNFRTHLLENKLLLIIQLIIIIEFFTFNRGLSKGIIQRTGSALAEYGRTGSMTSLSRQSNGKDEIGQILNACGAMSLRLSRKGSEFRQSNENLEQAKDDYNHLFATAMRLDAEVKLREDYPGLFANDTSEEVPLSREIGNLRTLAKIFDVQCDAVADNPFIITVPLYSLTLVADDVFRHYSDVKLSLNADTNMIKITFESSDTPDQETILNLLAIYEEDSVIDSYSFNIDNRLNPYLRLKHCFGNRTGLELDTSNGMKMVITIKTESDNYAD